MKIAILRAKHDFRKFWEEVFLPNPRFLGWPLLTGYLALGWRSKKNPCVFMKIAILRAKHDFMKFWKEVFFSDYAP